MNAKNKINIYFALALSGVALWGTSEALMLSSVDSSLIQFFGSLTYAFGIFIALNFLLFSFYFPFQNVRVSKTFISVLILISGLMFIISIIPGAVVKNGVLQNFGKSINGNLILNPLGFWLYFTIFILFFILSFSNLIRKYFSCDGFTKKQLKFIILGTFIFFIFAAIFDLIVPYFKGEILGWVGPYATIFMMFMICYMIFFSGKKLKIV